jgi:outer membrane lipase/esterase
MRIAALAAALFFCLPAASQTLPKGKSDTAPGQTAKTPGQQQTAPGGAKDLAPGHEQAPPQGNSDVATDQTGKTPGQQQTTSGGAKDLAPGHQQTAPKGKSDTAPGQTAETPGQQQTTPGDPKEAPKAVATQPGTVVVTTSSFTSAVLSRLDGTRGLGPSSGTAGPMRLGAVETSKSPRGDSPFTVYATGTLMGGKLSDLPNLTGLAYDAASATFGIEYAVNRYLIVGVAGNYTVTDIGLNSGAAVDLSAVHLAAYFSYATRQWFIDGLGVLGTHDVDMVRPGVADPVHGSTGGAAMALAARAGYLFDLGTVRTGPIAGLAYIRTRTDGYTETGDANLALTVSEQTLNSLTSSFGIRLLAPFQAGRTLIVPYLNVTWEHQFGDNSRVLTTKLAQAPALPPVMTVVPNFDARDFGKIESGVTVHLAPEISASLTGASTFAREEGHDFLTSAGLSFRF